MNKELQERLFTGFPKLYADRNASLQVSLMAFGFEVGDGWFDLLWRLSETLEGIINQLPSSDCLPRALQVKEKFGTLCFYMTDETDEMERAIQRAEDESSRTCEECGQPGQLRGRSWVVTMCATCYSHRTLV